MLNIVRMAKQYLKLLFIYYEMVLYCKTNVKTKIEQNIRQIHKTNNLNHSVRVIKIIGRRREMPGSNTNSFIHDSYCICMTT